MSTSSINSSRILKALNLKINSDTITKVVIPKEVIAEANSKMKEYRKTIKERRHASIPNKIRILRNKETDKSEAERRQELNKAMLNTRMWMQEAAEYFRGCIGAKSLEKFSGEIEKDFSTLIGKEYLDERLNDKSYEKYKKFPKEDYEITINQETLKVNHFRNCQIAYDYVCKEFQILLNAKIDGKNSLDALFRDKRQDAKKDLRENDILIGQFKATKSQITEYETKFNNAEKMFDKFISTMKYESAIVKRQILSTSEKLKKSKTEMLKAVEYTKKATFKVYFPLESKFTNNLVQAFKGFVEELNTVYDYISNGYKNSNSFKKEIAKRLEDRLWSKLASELPKSVKEFANAQLDNSNTNERSEQIRKITKKMKEQIDKMDIAAKKVDLYIDEVNNKYEEWQEAQSEKRKHNTKLIIFSLLGAFSALFSAFLPVFAAAADVISAEDVPFDPIPD